MKEVYASLDFGSSNIKFIVAEVINSKINILYAKKIPSRGISKGMVEDENIDVVAEDVKKLFEEAGNELKAPIKKVLVSIPAVHCHLYSSQGTAKILTEEKVITSTDVMIALKQANQFEKPHDEFVANYIPIRYRYDNVKTDKAPVGKRASSLKIDALIITSEKPVIYPYCKIVEKNNVELMDISINAYAGAKEVFDEASLDDGAILIDIGGNTTTLSHFQEGYLQFLNVENSGGADLSRYLAKAWGISEEKAETLKVKYGSCRAEDNDQDIVQIVGENKSSITYRKRDLANTLAEAAEILFNKISSKLARANIEVSDKKIFITGGGADLEGIEEVASKVFGVPVSTYRPVTIGARDMGYVNNLGMIYSLLDRKTVIDDLGNSLDLPSISNTVVLTRGLTKANEKGKLKTVIDKIIVDDEE